MRVIIRFSIDGETNGGVRKALAYRLTNVGIKNTRTGTWEHPDIPAANLALAMNGFWKVVAAPSSVPGAQEGVSIDHVWLYTDSSDSQA